MSYANINELEVCLVDVLQYCEEHPERGHTIAFEPLLRHAKDEFEETMKVSDQRYVRWRAEDGDERLAWKHLARELAQTQGRLRKVNALGFMDQKVMYWDQGKLIAAVDEMIEYLQERTGDLDFAAERAEKLQRQKEAALSDNQGSAVALKDYMRFSQLRADAISNAVATIASFRRTLRRELGRENPEYTSIRWPQAVASDEPVL